MSEAKNGRLDRRALIKASVLGAAAAGVAVPASAEEPVSDQPGIWWNEYLADDSARAAYFYSSVVGWRMKRVALDDVSRLAGPYEKSYIMMLSGSEDNAGIMRIADAEIAGARKGWFTYLQVPDVDAAVARAVQLGGKVVHEPYDESETTRIAIIEDTEGCLVGLAAARKG
jgi:predicted enzyme related to lactoylglutathione lyase